jgi:ATP-dependent RNA helicase RhlE
VSFKSFGLHEQLLSNVTRLGFEQPTPIQADAIPPALTGRDVLACAMTGSGKTAAFLLPIAQQLLSKPGSGTRALVLTPTRELASQVLESLEQFCARTGLKGAVIIGGVGMGPQEQAFRRGVDVLIATPGRLLDHLSQPYARLDGLQYLVLDEADRMLDMGFLPDIRRILKHVPARRQTLLFSATMPAPIVELTRDLLRDPVKIQLERKAAPATGVTQAIYPVVQDLKASLLTHLLQQGDIADVLVFTRTKHRCNRLTEHLVRHGVAAERIHGNRSQPQRMAALAGFKDGRFRVLVATDIAARGIDIEELGHVVNFDVPLAPEDYIHRVGRTARAAATGHAFTFVAPDEEGELRRIERAIGKALPRVTAAGFDYRAKPQAQLEIPLADRIREIRARKAAERARAAQKAAARQARPADASHGRGHGHHSQQGHGHAKPAHGHGHAASGHGHSHGQGQSHGQPGQRRDSGHRQAAGHGRRGHGGRPGDRRVF